MLLTIKRIK